LGDGATGVALDADDITFETTDFCKLSLQVGLAATYQQASNVSRRLPYTNLWAKTLNFEVPKCTKGLV